MCAYCDLVLVPAEDIPAKGHTVVTDPAFMPTCTVNGHSAGKHCSVCNYVIEPQIVEPAFGHRHGEDALCLRCGADSPHTVVIDEAVEPTCVAGKTEGSHCSECGIILIEQRALAPTDEHLEEPLPGEWDPTCSFDGLTGGSRCSKCGTVITPQEVIPAFGHQYANGRCICCGKAEGGDKN